MKWQLEQESKWPFRISIVDSNGYVITDQSRHSYSTKQKTIDDVMSGYGFDHKDRDMVVQANKKQLDMLTIAAAAPELLAALEAWEKAIPRLDEFASVSPDSLRGKALAAIAKAKGA